ncbi:MAG: YCF48-related protein [Ignavibacteria bacterium]|nr:YCF48-related protein [Ignavibacteria bacterium]
MIISFVIFLCFINSIFAQGWVSQVSGTNSTLITVSMIDQNTGYVLGNTVYKTTNGGLNWVPLLFGNGEIFVAMDFVNANTGFVTAFDTNGVVYKTTNGGLNWTSAPVLLGTSTRMFFLNSNQGYIVGLGGTIFATFTGGNLWIPQLSNTTNTLLGVYFINSFTGWTCGFNGTVLKTTNAGLSWTDLQSGLTTTLRDIYFINSNTGFMCGLNSRIYKTTNGGSNWSELYFNSSCGLNAVYFLNDQTGWIAGCLGIIDATTNGGVSWFRQTIGITTNLNGLSFVNSMTGWAVGFTGRILKTTNGGITFTEQNQNFIPSEYALHQNYPNPFNSETWIEFLLPVSGFVSLDVFDVSGRLVAKLINGFKEAGNHKVKFDGGNLSSGLYFYKLNCNGFTAVRKMIFLK